MTVSFDFDSVEGVAVAVAHGQLTLEDIKQCITDLWRLHQGPTCRALWDLRDAEFNLGRSEVWTSADFAKQHSPYQELRMAFVASEDLEFGLLRMWEIFREGEGVQTSVFRDREAALEWLTGDAA